MRFYFPNVWELLGTGFAGMTVTNWSNTDTAAAFIKQGSTPVSILGRVVDISHCLLTLKVRLCSLLDYICAPHVTKTDFDFMFCLNH